MMRYSEKYRSVILRIPRATISTHAKQLFTLQSNTQYKLIGISSLNLLKRTSKPEVKTITKYSFPILQ